LVVRSRLGWRVSPVLLSVCRDTWAATRRRVLGPGWRRTSPRHSTCFRHRPCEHRAPSGPLVSGALGLFIGVAAFAVLLASVGVSRPSGGTALGDVVTVQVRGVDLIAAVLALLLGALSVADVLAVNLRDRAGEQAVLAATGWRPQRCSGWRSRKAWRSASWVHLRRYRRPGTRSTPHRFGACGGSSALLAAMIGLILVGVVLMVPPGKLRKQHLQRRWQRTEWWWSISVRWSGKPMRSAGLWRMIGRQVRSAEIGRSPWVRASSSRQSASLCSRPPHRRVNSKCMAGRCSIASRVRYLGAPERRGRSIETQDNLVRDNYLASTFGGISIAQWQKILGLPNVTVAAPLRISGM